VSRAWLTIDSDIYVWKYEDGSDLAYFDGLNDTILSVGLVTPRPGILQSHIKVNTCECCCVKSLPDPALNGFTKPYP
jgi:nuclear pore complex protein Nup155